MFEGLKVMFARAFYLAKKIIRSVAFMAAIVFSQPSLATDWIQYRLTDGSSFAAWVMGAVSRNQYHMEVFWVFGPLFQHKHFDSSWDREKRLLPNLEYNVTRIAAVSRASNTMEIFWIAGGPGSVEHAWWYDGFDWSSDQLAPPGSAPYDSDIAVVSRASNTMEVFWPLPDGSVQHAWYYDDSGWGSGELCAPNGVSITSIAAVSRASNTMEVFWTGDDGSVQHAWWYDDSGWGCGQLAPPGSVRLLGVTALSRAANHMEIFWVGNEGSLQHAWYYDGSGWGFGELAPPGTYDHFDNEKTAFYPPAQAPVIASARSPETNTTWKYSG
jgi:hypothetical protein